VILLRQDGSIVSALLLDGKTKHTAQIDAFRAGGRDAADQLRRHRGGTAGVPTINTSCMFIVFQANDEIGRKNLTRRDRLHLILLLGLVAGHATT